MEEKTVSKTHKVLLQNRKSGSFSGIVDVLSFDVAEIPRHPARDRAWDGLDCGRGLYLLAVLRAVRICHALPGK